MLNDFTEIIKCELCGGDFDLSLRDTLSDYAITMDTNILNVFDNVDKLVNKYMVYVCRGCGVKVRYTYKEIDKLMRKAITKKLFMFLVKGLMTNSAIVDCKFLVYCGKCQGYDGNGSCPINVFDNCEIKRFPIYEL